MNLIRAEEWLCELGKAVQNEHLTVFQAHAEVFEEMESGDHDAETEKLFVRFTQSDTSEFV